MKIRLLLIIVLTVTGIRTSQAQVFIKLKVQFYNYMADPKNMYVDMPISLGVDFEKKIGVDKAISIGVANKSYNFSSNVNWASNNDFMTYVRDYKKDDFIDGWLADPEIKFHYINIPVGIRLQARLFFGLKYQAGINILINKPMFKDENFEVPIQGLGHAPVVIDHSLTVFFSAFGFIDMFGCYTLSQPLVKNQTYSYEFMRDFARRPSLISYGINFPLTKFKRKKI
jgi:hypothetical protein